MTSTHCFPLRRVLLFLDQPVQPHTRGSLCAVSLVNGQTEVDYVPREHREVSHLICVAVRQHTNPVHVCVCGERGHLALF